MSMKRALFGIGTAALLLSGPASAADAAKTQPRSDEVEALRAEVKRLAGELEAVKAKQAAATPAAYTPPPAPSAVPAQVAALDERVGLLEIKQGDAVVAGDVPGSFRVPNTDVSLRLYGFAELNYIHEFKGDNSDVDIPAFAAYAPVKGSPGYERKDRDFLTARTSRFGIEAATPTRYGPLGVKLEGDFINEPRTGGTEQNGSTRNLFTQQETSSYGFRMRHVYGSIGGLLVGQTWSTFMDVDNSPETVDFNGPPGSSIVRQPMIRYGYATPTLGKLTVALENSSSYVLGDAGQGDEAGLPMSSSLSRIPDVILRWDRAFGWGNLSVRGLGQELRVKDGQGIIDATRIGWGAGATAFVKLRDGADYLSLALTGGEGIGRYMYYVEGAIYDTTANEIRLERAAGAVAGYQFKPSGFVRFNFVYGIVRSFDNAYVDAARASGFDTAANLDKFAINRQVQQAHVGAIFTPVSGVDLGIEGIWGQRSTLAGEKGDLTRFNFMARYYIN
jgi:outer membrane murein-binding lipoprotein Lpp